jgi:hypothetical protein
MGLQLWSGEGGHFFIDYFQEVPVQVGQAYESDGSWVVEVNDRPTTVPDLEAAKRMFVEKYDRSLVQVGPISLDQELSTEGFSVIDLQEK